MAHDCKRVAVKGAGFCIPQVLVEAENLEVDALRGVFGDGDHNLVRSEVGRKRHCASHLRDPKTSPQSAGLFPGCADGANRVGPDFTVRRAVN